MPYKNCRVQQDATNFDFRKRHYEMKRAKEELEYQMKTVMITIQLPNLEHTLKTL